MAIPRLPSQAYEDILMQAHPAWDEQYDVVVVGSGFAGLAAAISAHDAGAHVLVIEKMAFPNLRP